MEEERDEGMEEERWRKAVGYEGWYDVSDWGRVKRVKAASGTQVGRILKTPIDDHGYQQVNLYKNGKNHSVKVQRLVTDAFIGPCPEGLQRNHIDGDKTNNHVENLEYVTTRENLRHARMTGLMAVRGEDNGSSKLTEEKVHDIRRRLLNKEQHKSIADSLGVSVSAINAVSSGQNWAWLKEEDDDERT